MQGTPRTPKLPPRKSTLLLTSSKPYRIRSVTRKWTGDRFYGYGRHVKVVRRETEGGKAVLICSYKDAQRQFTFEVKDGTYVLGDETASAEETEDELEECSTRGCTNHVPDFDTDDRADLCDTCWAEDVGLFKMDL